MLIEFKVKNFRSFKDEQIFSMLASSNRSENDRMLEGNTVKKDKYRLLKTAAIYGANASGKSNFVKAIDFVATFVRSSLQRSPNQETGVQPFRLDPKYAKDKTEFSLIFINNNIRYAYGFNLTNERICDEWLYAFPKGRMRLVFERKFADNNKTTAFEIGSTFGNRKILFDTITKDFPKESLLLPMLAKWEEDIISGAYRWFEKLVVIDSEESLPPITAIKALNNQQSKDKIAELLKKADLGITGFSVREEEIKLENLPKDILNKIPEEEINKILGKKSISLDFKHTDSLTKYSCDFGIEDESEGTKKFFDYIAPILEIVESGYCFIIDELSRSIHTLLAIELVNFVNAKAQNGQMIFTLHNTSLLSGDILRRDQIWFTEKDASGATQMYSLSDYKNKPRSTEAIENGYLAGRYGGVPFITHFGETDG